MVARLAWRVAELAGGQHEDRVKAEVNEIGLEKRSACVFEVQGRPTRTGTEFLLPFSSLSHGENMGSSPLGSANKINNL